MTTTVVGLVQSRAEADSVVNELVSVCGCERDSIGLMARDGEAGEERGNTSGMGERAMKGVGAGAAVGGVLGLVAGAAALAIPGFGPLIAAGPIASALAGAGIGAAAGGVIGALSKLGVPEEHAHYYAEGVRRGGTLITVRTEGDSATKCAERVLKTHGAVDIEERASQWKEQGWSGRLGEGEALPVTEEELAVGKRTVTKGGVRVYSTVAQKPVEETVALRSERATIERRPVNRPVTSADEAFKEKTIEIDETAEEPVVEKRSRVVEEVRVGKQAEERLQTIRDNVRSTEVHVERTGEKAPMSASGSGYNGPERRKATGNYAGTERRILR